MPAKKIESAELTIISPLHHETVELFSYYYSLMGNKSQITARPDFEAMAATGNKEICLLYGDQAIEFYGESLAPEKPYFYIGTQESSSINSYGVVETVSNPQALFSIFPEKSVRSVLFFYEQNSIYSETMYSLISKHLNINAIPSVKIPLLNDISRYNTLAIKEHSLVIVLSRLPNPSFIQRLSLICNHHQTPLIVSNLHAVSYGASVGFGLHPYDSAKIIRDMVNNYRQKGLLPYSSSISIEPTILINKEALYEQGFSFQKESKQLVNLLGATKIIEPSTREKIDAHVRLERHALE